MKAIEHCRPCLGRLIYQAAERATDDLDLKTKAIDEALKFLNKEFSLDRTSIYLSTRLHRIIRAVTANPDPYRQMKETEVKLARDLTQSHPFKPGQELNACLKYAVQGNAIDFFRDLETVKQDLTNPIDFVRDDSEKLGPMLKKALSVLYLADNTGEVLFDLPLVRFIEHYAPVTYVVKASPVQNDVTLEDLHRFRLFKSLSRVITTGTDTPGVDMSMASAEFKEEFENTSLILAKGMGYWETLSELPAEGKTFHLLKAKCHPVAASLNVPVNSCLAFLR